MTYNVFDYMSKRKMYTTNPTIYISLILDLFHSLKNKKDMYQHLTRTVKFSNSHYINNHSLDNYSLIRLYSCVFGSHKLLKKINIEIIQKYINTIFVENSLQTSICHYKYLTYPSFLYFEKYIPNIDYNYIFKKLCIVNDERLFKYIINKVNFDNYSIINIEDIILHLRHKEKKFILKRLKYINNYYDLSQDISIMFKFNNFQILKAIMKYYYKNELTLKQNVYLVNEIHNVFDFHHIYDLLLTTREKDIFNIIYSIRHYSVPIKPLSKDNYIEEFDMIKSSSLSTHFSGSIAYLKIPDLIKYKSIIGIDIILHSLKYHHTSLKMFVYSYDCKDVNIVQTCSKKYFNLCVFIRMMKNKYKYIRKMKLAPLLNEIKNLTPNDNIKVLSRLSHIHRERLQKFSKVPPYTLFPGGLDIIKTNIFIREKADGYLVYSIPNNPFEKQIKAEYIEDDDIYLVFDIDNSDTIVDRYNHLRHCHPSTQDTNIEYINSPDDFIRLLTEERNRYENFLKNRNGINWYPKASYMVANIDTIKDYLYSIANSTNQQTIDFICNGDKNDGLIITPLNGDREIKIKPRHQMTIDLLYKNKYFIDRNNVKYKIKCDFKPNNNTIYRCYPLLENDYQYEARDVRFDKKKPNTEVVVKTIMSLVKADYTFTKKLYYTNHTNRTQEWISIMKTHRKHVQTAINKMNNGYNVLDLGCGSGKLLSFNINYSGYIGIDYDTYILNKAYNRFNGQNAIFNFMDLAEQWNDTPNIWMTMRPKSYSNIYAISSLMHFNTKTFWDNIDKMSSIGTKFMFNLLNKKILDYDKYTFDSQISNNYIYHKDGYVYYKFNCVHKEEMKEKYITIDNITMPKWKIIHKEDGTNTLNELYTYYIIEKII
jgi:cyclopropane fatty-acyl-phospholipid synthase-like methyltransferase